MKKIPERIEIRNDGIQPIFVSACRTKLGKMAAKISGNPAVSIVYVHVSDFQKTNTHPDRAEKVEAGDYNQIEVGEVEG